MSQEQQQNEQNEQNSEFDATKYAAEMAEMKTKLSSMEAAIIAKDKELEEIEKKPAENQREKDIKIAHGQDIVAEREAMFADLKQQKDNYMIEMRETFELDNLKKSVVSSKKSELEDILIGKTMKEQIEYIDKYRTTYLFDSGSYNHNAANPAEKSKSDALKHIMDGNFIRESGLTEQDIKDFVEPDSIIKFEKEILREFKSIRSPQALNNFFNKQR